jgi:hypothetical protein
VRLDSNVSGPDTLTGTPVQRHGGSRKSISRRPGQDGYEEVKGNWYHVRFRIDVAGQEIRKYKSVAICPVSGPGALGKLERLRKRREIIQASGADTEEHFNHVQCVNLGTTFRAQAKWWLEYMQNRTRKPIMPNTASGWQQVIDNWLNPSIGDMPLAEVRNRTLKELVAKMVGGGLSAKSVNNYIQVLKMVVASAVDEDGDELYPRKWNHDFADVPLIEGQHTPEFTAEEVSDVVANTSGRYRMLCPPRWQQPTYRRSPRAADRAYIERPDEH